MSADHRKPVVAFVVLALAAAAIVGIQRADARAGRFLAAAIGTSVRVQGTIPTAGAAIREAAFGPAFASLDRTLRGDRSEPFRATAHRTIAVAPAAPKVVDVSHPTSRGAARRDVPGRRSGHGAVAEGQHAPGRKVAAERPGKSVSGKTATPRRAVQRGATRPELPRMMSRSEATLPGHAHSAADRTGRAGRADGRAGRTGRADRPGRAEHRGRGTRRGWARGFTSADRPSR